MKVRNYCPNGASRRTRNRHRPHLRRQIFNQKRSDAIVRPPRLYQRLAVFIEFHLRVLSITLCNVSSLVKPTSRDTTKVASLSAKETQKMKRFVLAIALTGLISVTVLAGEVPINGAPAVPPPPTTSSTLLTNVVLTIVNRVVS